MCSSPAPAATSTTSPVADVRRFEAELLDWFRARHADLLDGIRDTGDIDDDALEAGIKASPPVRVDGDVGGSRRRAQLPSRSRQRPTCPRTRRCEARTEPMAGGQERVLRRRIKSVQSTKKITKAMELIAASRIVKAQQRVAAARPYSEQITEVIRNLAAAGAGVGLTRCSRQREDGRHGRAIVVIAADRGLAGGYNSSVIRAAERAMLGRPGRGPATTRSSPSARRPTAYFRFRGYEIDESFTGFSDEPDLRGRPRGRRSYVAERFEAGEYDQVELVYTQFLSLGTPAGRRSARFLPLETGGRATRRRGRRRARRPTTSSSPARTRSSTGCCPATPRPACSPRCSTPRRPSTPPASGP